jgi:hypothetical protein
LELTMSTDVMERLRAADPARGLQPDAPEELLARLKTPRRRRRRRAVVLAPVAVAAAVAAAVVLPGADPDLAARAYAQTAAAGDRILYVRTAIVNETRTPSGMRVSHAVRERWEREGRWRERLDIDGRVSTQTLGADGVLRFSDGKVAPRGYAEQYPPDFVEGFRTRYERGTLKEDGTTTFNRRPAKRYVADGKRTSTVYFVDAETGVPLGSVETFAVLEPKPDQALQHQAPNGTFTATTTVEAIEQLPATPANLGALSG